MTLKRIPRPRDPIQLAKLIGDIFTGQVVGAVDDGKDKAAARACGFGRLRHDRPPRQRPCVPKRTC
jgi:hypothetical protein